MEGKYIDSLKMKCNKNIDDVFIREYILNSSDVYWAISAHRMTGYVVKKEFNLSIKGIKNINFLMQENLKFLNTNDTMYVYIFDKPQAITDIKEYRIYYNRNKDILLMLFNDNSIHLINFGNLLLFPKSIDKINFFIDSIKKNDLEIDRFLIDSTGVLCLYGIRPIGDIDFLTDYESEYKKLEIRDKIEANFKYTKFHTTSMKELMYNPKYYLLYKGIKVICLDELAAWKKAKGTRKDKEDYDLINLFLLNDKSYRVFRTKLLAKRLVNKKIFKILVPIKRVLRQKKIYNK